MTKYLVATHGELAKGFVDTLHMIAGADAEVGWYCMPKDLSGDDVARELRERLADWKENRYVVLTDLMGGSVNNALTAMLLEGMDFQLVTGTNLALLIGLALSAEEDLEEAVAAAVEDARNGIVHVNTLLAERRGER